MQSITSFALVTLVAATAASTALAQAPAGEQGPDDPAAAFVQQLDTDGDHVIDRWETLRPDGSVSVSAPTAAMLLGPPGPRSWRMATTEGSSSTMP